MKFLSIGVEWRYFYRTFIDQTKATVKLTLQRFPSTQRIVNGVLNGIARHIEESGQ